MTAVKVRFVETSVREAVIDVPDEQEVIDAVRWSVDGDSRMWDPVILEFTMAEIIENGVEVDGGVDYRSFTIAVRGEEGWGNDEPVRIDG